MSWEKITGKDLATNAIVGQDLDSVGIIGGDQGPITGAPPAVPDSSWLPNYPVRLTRPALLAAIAAGSFFAGFIPSSSAPALAAPSYPDRIEKKTVQAAQQQAFFYEPSPEYEPSTDWAPEYPDQLLPAKRLPGYPATFYHPNPEREPATDWIPGFPDRCPPALRLREYQAFFFDSLVIGKFELGWLPRYPDRCPAPRSLFPQQELFVEPRAEYEPSVDWRPIAPDRCPPAARLLDPPAFFYQPFPEYEPTLDWGPAYPSQLLPARRSPAFEVLAPFQPAAAAPAQPWVFYPDRVFPARRPVESWYAFAPAPIAPTFFAAYGPDQLLPARRVAHSWVALQPYPEREPAVDWIPAFPDRIPRAPRLFDPPASFLQPYPPRTPDVDWLGRYPDILLGRRGQWPHSWLDPYPRPPVPAPDLIAVVFPDRVHRRPVTHTGASWAPGLTALAAVELSWQPRYQDRLVRLTRPAPLPEVTAALRADSLAPGIAWGPCYPDRVPGRPVTVHQRGGSGPLWELGGFAVPPLTWRPQYPDRYRLLRGLWVHEQQALAFLDTYPPPTPPPCVPETHVISLTSEWFVTSLDVDAQVLSLSGVNTVGSLEPERTVLSLSPEDETEDRC